jgi:hypothetical protein
MNDNTDNEIAHRRSKREQGKKKTKRKGINADQDERGKNERYCR